MRFGERPRRRSPRGRRARPNGQSIVEFALILPVLIILLLGAIDFGRLLQARVTSESATRAGAAWGATNLQTARQLLPPAAVQNFNNCGSNSYGPSCNVLAQACREAAGFPNFGGGPAYQSAGGLTYQVCAAGSSGGVCSPGVGQSNPFLVVAWSHASGSGFVPSDSLMPVAGDRITVTGTFCFRTLASYPLIPNQTLLVTSSTYTVQQ